MTENVTTPKTLQEAVTYFSDEDRCIAYLVSLRWPDGVTCPTCGTDKVSYLKTQRRWKCYAGHKDRRQFSVKVGTIMEDSPISLTKWLPAMWMIANCKNGISSYELHRALGITQKTAWFLNHRIRLAMQEGNPGLFSGQVEADETYIGGLARNMHKSKKAKITGTGGSGKTAVMGLLERHISDKASRVKAIVVPNTKRETLQGQVRQNVELGTELYTDALASYYGLDPEYVHQVIDHAEAYVKGNVHTNGIENFWSLLKRSIKGTYVSVEPFHLFRYLDEQAFRFNERKVTDSERFAEIVSSVVGKRLSYQELTGKMLEPPKA